MSNIAIPKMTEEESQVTLGVMANYLAQELKAEGISAQGLILAAYQEAKEMLASGDAKKIREVHGKEAVTATINAHLTDLEEFINE